MLYLVVIVATAMATLVSAQQTAQTSVALHLRECYSDPLLLNRNNLPPTTMPVLIDIIRQLEDNPNINLDLRELSSLLLHTYRQDGIEFHQPETSVNTVNILPFAATHYSFHRHKLLLSRLIPNSLQILTDDFLPSALKCALHHMLSTTIDAREKADESVCSRLSQFVSLRLPRSLLTSVKDDVEILDKSVMNSVDRNGQMRDYTSNDGVEIEGVVYSSRSQRQTATGSQCPILTGVVDTAWGSVSAGNLVAGIAAGAQPQRVPISELVKDITDQQTVISLYPATLSGDLSEAVLVQGVERGSNTISIGAASGWNSTEARKFHMVQSRTNIEMTDPEIRGGLDGLIVGSNIQTILSTYSSLKLSQLLDMYYTARNGVFNENLRACNRKVLSTQVTDEATLRHETLNFATALDRSLPVRGTVMTGLESLVNSAVQNFLTYTSSNLNDVSCVATEASTVNYRLRTNLYLVVDATWAYEAIYPAISYLLDSIEVSKYGSSVTLLSAFDGSVVVNTTFSLAEFHANYILTKHQSMLTGVNLLNAYTNIRNMMLATLDKEKDINYIGGNSTVLLFLLNNGNLNTNNEIWEEARAINDTVPDLKVLFATSTRQVDTLWSYVRDMHNDIHTVTLSANNNDVSTTMDPILNRIRLTGRRVINPNCGSRWNGGFSGSQHFEDYVEPNYVNFYAIRANYFYVNDDNRKIRIVRTGGGFGSLVICHSRGEEQPRMDTNVRCDTLTGSGNVELPIRYGCEDYETISACPPFHFSVQSLANGTTTTSAVCTDNSCRFPYNIRYQVHIDSFGCYNGTSSMVANFMFIFTALLISLKIIY